MLTLFFIMVAILVFTMLLSVAAMGIVSFMAELLAFPYAVLKTILGMFGI